MKKRVFLFITIMVLLCGCGVKSQESQQLSSEQEVIVEETAEEPAAETEEESEEAESVFVKLPESFMFSSGAGGWWTDLRVESDGTFYGNYHDSELGSTGEGYPNGTCYICEFKGKFAPPVQVSEYVYSTSVETIDYDEPEKEYIKDEIKYITSSPYGMDNAGEILIYLYGAPKEQVPEGFISWLPEREIKTNTLEYYGIYNVNEETAFIAEKSEAEEQEFTPADLVSEGPAQLQVMVGNHYLSEWDTDLKLCSLEWESLMLGEEDEKQFPALAKKLQNMSTTASAEKQQWMDEMLPEAKEVSESMPGFNGFMFSSEYYVQRADGNVLSIRAEEEEYTGGAHPYYWTRGINLDSVTGEELKLSDVLKDADGISEILYKKLKEKYRDTEFFDLETTLSEYENEQLTWTLNYQGITFYFSPYELASYADGMFQITLWYDEMPELFAEKYIEAPTDGWAIPLPAYREFEMDRVPGDGKRDTLYITTMQQESDYNEVYVSLNGNEVFLENCEGYRITPNLVCMNDSGVLKYFLYVETTVENDYRTMYIYDLNGDKPELCAELSGVGYAGKYVESAESYIWFESVFHNPPEIYFDTTIQMLGTWSGCKTYRVNPKDGVPVAMTDYYTITESERPLVLKRELEVLALPQQTKETLPAGTKLYLKRTDGKTYAELELEDGRECRIEIIIVDYTSTINGISEWEYFEELMYAG